MVYILYLHILSTFNNSANVFLGIKSEHRQCLIKYKKLIIKIKDFGIC